jgi:hypothetical protein
MLELYHSINSVCAQKVRLALTEKETRSQGAPDDAARGPV